MKNTADKRNQPDARRGVFCLKILPQIIAGCFGCGAALANPAGQQVVNGQVSVVNQGNTLTVTNSPGSIINWQSFSINANETTRFIQQNSASSVLNRITGQDPSQILGALQSNGRVFLINPNGILFGSGARVDVNGLIASTLNLSNEDFLAGKLNFKSGLVAGNIQNQGAITTPSGGQVYLIAPNVENSGIITSPKGEVILAAGHTIQLVDSANPDLHIVISASENQAINLGQVIAQGGKVGIYGALVNQRGVVNANSAVVGENGKIVFKASRDTFVEGGSVTSATGAGTGGDIRILGERVALTGDAKVDASGQTGGGTVLVGGDYQGKNVDVPNAKQVYFGTNAEIKADAIDSGNGGKVVLWSDDTTRAYGAISARGGAQSGDGGFVETSGKKNLAFDARIDTTAAHGKAGSVFLDPTTITIAAGSGGAQDAELSDNNILFTDTPSNFVISKLALESLGATNNVTLEATGDITLNDLGGNALSFQQANGYTVTFHSSGGNITTTNANDRITTYGGNLTMLAGGTGNITIGGVRTGSVGAGGVVTMNAGGSLMVGEIDTKPFSVGVGGNVNLTSGASMMLGKVDVRHSGGGAADVVLNSGGAIKVQSAQTIFANKLQMFATGGITDDQGAPGPVNTQINAINARNSGTGVIKISNTGSNLSIEDIGATGYGITQLAAGQDVHIYSGPGESININGAITSSSGPVILEGAGGVNVGPSNNIVSNGGGVSLISYDSGAAIGMAVGSGINSSGGTILLKSDKMALSGNIQAAGGVVELLPFNPEAIWLGTGSSDVANALELSSAELNSISTGKLLIGGVSSSTAIDIQSAIAPSGLTGPLELISAGLVSQQTNATIGATSLYVRGEAVTLTQANPVGVIAGQSTGGNFEYRSANQLTLNTVDSYSGLNAGTYNIMLGSDSPLGINQVGGNPIVAGGLALKTVGPVLLTEPANSFGMIAADLFMGGAGTGDFNVFNSTNLAVDGLMFGLSGIATHDKQIFISTGANQTLTVNKTINAGAHLVHLQTDNLTMGAATVNSGEAISISPTTANRRITVGSSTCNPSPCLAVVDLYKFVAPSLGIGKPFIDPLPAGDIFVAGITSGSVLPTDINPITTRIGLLTGGGVTQSGAIQVQDLGIEAGGNVTLTAANAVTNLAATNFGNFSFTNNLPGFNVATLISGPLSSFYTMTGITSNGGGISLISNAGDINVSSLINAGTANVNLAASSGAITGSGLITAAGLTATANSGIGSLITQVTNLSATNASGAINISNTGSLNLGSVQQTTGGGITIGASGGMLVGGAMTSNGGGISLTASTGNVNLSSTVNAGAGNVSLLAGAAIVGSGLVTGTALTATANSGIGAMTQVSALTATNGSGAIGISNTGAGALSLNGVQQTTGGNITIGSAGPLTIATGMASSGGAISLSSSTGNINAAAPINAGTGSVTLNASAGAITGGGLITGAGLNATANSGIGSLTTKVGNLTATNAGGNDIDITNTGTLVLNNMQQTSGGNITIDNTGALTVAAGQTVSTNAGNISLIAHSPLDILGTVSSSTGTIWLEAGAAGFPTDQLNISGSVMSSTGDITLKAGDAINGTASTAGILTLLPYQNTPPVQVPVVIAPLVPALTSPLVTSLEEPLVLPSPSETTVLAFLSPEETKSDSQETTSIDSAGTVSPIQNGAKNDAAAKKMYCN